jgi:predicted permease
MLTAGLGNTSFVGLPMTQAFYGPEGVPIALVADQLGSFLTLSTLGLITAARMSAGEPSARVIIKRVVTFPPFIALCIAATLGRALVTPELLPFTVPNSISEASRNVFQTLASTLAPLALFSVGFQLRLGEVRTRAADLSLGLLLKLTVAPGLMAGIALATGLGLHGLVPKVTLLEAGMAPMITAGIIATEHKLDPVLCGLMVAVGIPLSFVTLGALVWMLG